MADLVIAEYEDIANVADAIRSKTGITDTMTLSEMATNVMSISGTDITIDSELSETSTNPVQNKVITKKFNELSIDDKINGKADKTDIVQSDWNVNDETSFAYVKNRIGGYFVDSEITLFDDNLTFSQYEGTGVGINNQDFDLVLGETYQVVIDGVEYEPTVCKEYKSMYATYKVLGNPSLHNASYENSGEEYLWMDKFHFFMAGKSNTTVSVKIIGKAKEIVPIDKKFLPEISFDNLTDKPTADDALALLAEVRMIDPIIDANGAVYMEDNNVIYTL